MMKLLKITIPEPAYKYKNGSKVFALYFGFGNEELLRRDYAATLKQRIAKIIADSFVTEQAVFLPYHDLYCVIFRSNIDKRQLFRLCETLLGEADTYTEGKLKIFYHFTKCVIVEEGKAPGPFHFAFTGEELCDAYASLPNTFLEHKERRNMHYLADLSDVKWH